MLVTPSEPRVCNHIDPKRWVHRQTADGQTIARCPVCERFMGYVMPEGRKMPPPPRFNELKPKDEAPPSA